MTQLRSRVTVLGFGAAIATCATLAVAQGSLPARAQPAGGTTVARTPPPPPKTAGEPRVIATALPNAAGPPGHLPPMHPTVGHGGPAFTALSPADKAGVVNAARAKFNMAALSQAEAVALAGGVLLTPDAPVSGKSYLGYKWGTLVDVGTGGAIASTTRTSYVLRPVPMDATDAWHLGHVTAEVESQIGRLYVADCAITSPQALTVSVVVRHGRAAAQGSLPQSDADRFFASDNPAIAFLDAKSTHALVAFRAKGAVAQLDIETYQTSYVPNKLALNGDDNYFAFTGCAILPAQP